MKMNRFYLFILGLLTFPVCPVIADERPSIVALSATQSDDGTVRLIDGHGAFSVAITNSGGAGAVRLRLSLDGEMSDLRMNICETDTATAVCLSSPARNLNLFVNEGDQRSFSVFIRDPVGAPAFTDFNVILLFEDEGGEVVGAIQVPVRPSDPQQERVPNWLSWLLVGSIAYGLILVVYRFIYPRLQRVSS